MFRIKANLALYFYNGQILIAVAAMAKHPRTDRGGFSLSCIAH